MGPQDKSAQNESGKGGGKVRDLFLENALASMKKTGRKESRIKKQRELRAGDEGRARKKVKGLVETTRGKAKKEN